MSARFRNFNQDSNYKLKQINFSFTTTRGHTDLSHLVLAPEAGIMQWCVPVLIGCISVCFALDQLKMKTKQKIMSKTRLVRSCLDCKQGWVLMSPRKSHWFVLPVDTYQRYWDMSNIKRNSCLAAILNQTPSSESLTLWQTVHFVTRCPHIFFYQNGLILVPLNKYNNLTGHFVFCCFTN